MAAFKDITGQRFDKLIFSYLRRSWGLIWQPMHSTRACCA
jgi:hypothetical protein